MRVGYVEVVVVLLYEIVSINVHLMLDAFFVSFHCIFSYFTFTNWTFQRFFLFITYERGKARARAYYHKHTEEIIEKRRLNEEKIIEQRLLKVECPFCKREFVQYYALWHQKNNGVKQTGMDNE